MADQPPPPPPPHGGPGGAPRSGGLPPGKYDIFVIPEHSAGSGFIYLPSLKPNINSFVAGFASALILVVLGQSMAPAFRTWWESFQGLGNMAIVMLIAGVGFGAWALGRTQQDGGGGFGPGSKPKPDATSGGYSGTHPGATPHADASPPPPPPPHGNSGQSHHHSAGPNGGPPPHGARNHDDGYYPTGGTPPPHAGTPPPREPPREPPNEQPKPEPKPEPRHEPKPEPKPEPKSEPKPQPKKEPPKQDAPKSAWEKARDQYKGSWERAREETRKKEEERKAKEAEQKRREETARKLAELRAKEAKERQAREMEKQRREKEAKDKEEKLRAQQQLKELTERLEREKKERERLEQERQAKLAKEAEERKKEEAKKAEESKKSSSYAFSGVGERMSMWPNGRPPVPKHSPAPSVASRNPPSPEKKPPPPPSAKTYMSEETHSYRPYDGPGRPRKKSVSSYAGSDASWAPSQTTNRTSPPPSMRGPYSTKDPDKIMISAVYLFMNEFAKTPASQLISGIGSVTDGLILRITTEGLFIDDDVRGVPQREWDVKAWTLKSVEVWCPPHCLNSSSASSASSKTSPNLLHKMAQSRARNADKNANKAAMGEEADAYLAEMLRACNDCCRLGLCERTFKNTNIPSPSGQTGEWKSKGLHVLRATLRDQEAKRYMFIIDEAEAWKMTQGLQRLRRGTQVRQLRVSGMSGSDARGTLEMLGWGT